jgi:putative ABC transport system permease protein
VQRSPGEAVVPAAYVPYAQFTGRTLRLVVRSSTDPMVLAPALRSVIREADPGLPLSEMVPLGNVVRQSVARPRFYTSLLALFAGVALALAAVGIFGVMSFSVAQRSHEISIRMALGAHAREVAGMVVRSSMVLAGAGLLLGLVAALVLGRLLASQLYNVSAADPLTMAGVALVLLATALAASWLPARRAAGMAPGDVLRGG